MEIFATTLACVDTAIRMISSIKAKFEAYRKSTTLLKTVREKLKSFKETLERESDKTNISVTSWGVLERIRKDFVALNNELEDINHRLAVRSKVEKWFSSGKDVASFESISTHLTFLEKHFDIWAMSVDLTQKILEELRNIYNLIYHVMRNCDGYRDDQKRVLHMLSSALDRNPIQQFVNHPNPGLRRAIEMCEAPNFGQEFSQVRVFTALTDIMPKLMHKLSDEGGKLGDQHELLERLKKFWDTCTVCDGNNENDADEIQLDIDMQLVRLDAIHEKMNNCGEPSSNSSRRKPRWNYVDENGRHSMADHDDRNEKQRRTRNRRGERNHGDDMEKSDPGRYALVPWNGRGSGRLQSIDDRHRANGDGDGNRRHQEKLNSQDDLEEHVSSQRKTRKGRHDNGPLTIADQNVGEGCHDDFHYLERGQRKAKKTDGNRPSRKRSESFGDRKNKPSLRSRSKNGLRENGSPPSDEEKHDYRPRKTKAEKKTYPLGDSYFLNDRTAFYEPVGHQSRWDSERNG